MSHSQLLVLFSLTVTLTLTLTLLIKVKEESEKAGLNSTFGKQRSWYQVPSLHGKQMGKKWKQ